MSYTSLLLLLSSMLILASINITAGQDQCKVSSGNFTTNSTYGRNRDLIFSSLASNVTANGGFYTVDVGQGPDKVYALGLCRGDFNSSSSDCASCINSGIQDIMKVCPNQKEALSWGSTISLESARIQPCIVRYANSSFLGRTEMHPDRVLNYERNLTFNQSAFDKIWGDLMVHVVDKTAGGSSRLKFATGEANVTYFSVIYALMQCTPDLSRQDCEYCLHESLACFQSSPYRKQGGVVLRPSCFVRWELYPFYTPIADAPSPSPSFPPPPPPPVGKADKGSISSRTVAIIVVSPVVLLILLIVFSYICLRRSSSNKKKKNINADGVDDQDMESLQFDFNSILVATNNFSVDNKLGEGGFGVVYKGKLPNGQDVAVKRLSVNSRQGELEFKNEVLLVAKLQHRNLVRLLGFCLEGNERLLVYELMPNSSLDNFLFDPIKRLLLKWDVRYNIIRGIARGILYLHEDSRFRIIHRDLKASNILLDQNMNSKISDFGMAKLFEMDQTHTDTTKVVGTFGYMAPEYVWHGNLSAKTDVFSFGVLVLEIISGQKNSSFCNGEEPGNLLTYAWESWKEGTSLNLIDPTLRDGPNSEMLRCIHIGLLCVQENVADRPTMASVVLMLASCSISLSAPTRPAFFMLTTTIELNNQESTLSGQSKSRSVEYSVNEASITELDPR